MNLINELRMLAEDLYVNWYSRYSSAMSKAADEFECLRTKIEAIEKQTPVAWAATDETCRIVEALSFNQSRRFDTPLGILPSAQPKPDCGEAGHDEGRCGNRQCLPGAQEQEPARLVTPTAYRWRYRGAIKWQYGELTEEAARLAKEHNHEVQSLYALPGAQPQLNEIRTALQRALELGARETWTGARKHRSWEDQREEQQCWNKVWSLLGAQGEEK